MNNKELQITATKVRKGIVEAVHSAKSGHPGGSLSAADMFTYLYFEEMNIDPKDPKIRSVQGTHCSGSLFHTRKQRLLPC